MLDRDDQSQSAAKLIASWPCRVVLTPKLEERFTTEGIAPTPPDDRRQHPRLRCRDKQHRAGLQHIPTYPALQRGDDWSAVYLADISRGGLQIIHSQPLYPGEKLRLLMNNGSNLLVAVVRCRRLGEACYMVGTRLVTDAAASN